LWILLPIEKVLGRLDIKSVRDDLGTAVRRRAQTNHLGPQRDRAIVSVVRRVMKGDPKAHMLLRIPRPTFRALR